ncbi:permease for cytosine/purines, uracil, thiamine, allantoin domain-containing protein [Trichoderma ceciliae]
MGLGTLIERAKLPYVSQWINEDIRPVEAARRTWGFWTFHNYWLLINCNIATFLTGSALIPLGLNWWQAIIAIIVGNILATTAIVISSLSGAYYHIGFSVYSRAVWGMWGSQFAIWNRIFLCLGMYGFQSWVGGQCFELILLSWDPKYESRIPNHMPASTGMTTAQFVSYVIFFIISLPFVWIKPHRLQKFFYFACVVTMVFFVVLLIWALASMGQGGFGNTLDSATTLPKTGGPGSVAWLMVYGIMSTIGSIAAGILNQNDFARLARKPMDAVWGQLLPYGIYSIFTSVIGILVVAATQKRFDGEAVWNPPTIFVRLLEKDDSPGTRAALFFAGVALCISQIGSNVPGNALAGGIDLSSVFPRYINIRRGAYITVLLSPIVNPWQLVNTATTFLSVLSSYGVFLAPMTGMMFANYVVVNKRKVKLDDLFRGHSGSIYWYKYGVNFRAAIAWAVGVAPTLPGFIAAVNLSVSLPVGMTELYYLNYLYGFVSSAVVYAALHWIFPAKEVDDFVRSAPSAKEVQRHYTDRWEVDLSQASQVLSEDDSSGITHLDISTKHETAAPARCIYTQFAAPPNANLVVAGLFCKSRGLICKSSPTPDEISPQQESAADSTTENGASDAELVTPPGMDSSPALARRSISHSSPADTIQSSAGLSAAGDLSLEQQSSAPAAVVHQGLVRQSVPSGDGLEQSSYGLSPPVPLASNLPLHTLEDNFNRTAHSMGPSAEQDTYLLDAFRCLIISENDEIDANIIQVYPGGPSADDRPVHFLLLENENPDFTNEAKQTASDGTETLVWPYGEHLVRLYFKHVHPTYPVVTKTRFLRQYKSNRMKIPASLRGAMYGMACVFWGRDHTMKEACPFQQHQCIDHAHEALRREHENPNLFSLQAALLLHHVTPPDVDSVETPSMWTMTAQTTACAQTIGLHQDPTRWSIEPWEKRVRKKLWWAVYASDCWSAICHGNPPHISPSSFSTAPPDMDDIRADETVPEELRYLVEPEDAVFQASVGARFLQFINLTIVLRDVLDCSFQVRPSPSTLAERATQLVMLREKFNDWHSLLPQCLALGPERGQDVVSNCPLHLTYYATQALLYRGLMYPATRAAKATPESNLRKWFVPALNEFQSFVYFFKSITEEDLRGFWCRHARSQLILCGNFLIYLFLLASDELHIEAAYQLLQEFHLDLKRLGDTTHKPGRLLLRPVRLRLDSFFRQAATILRGNEAPTMSPINTAG